ncbi:MAG: pyridoxamine 5'-phosphate oxidase family protein [Bacteroidales bacterium]|nr:pyridoxamine 5'-phosphate oxidase family protein [Bacteroidales bacterium]
MDNLTLPSSVERFIKKHHVLTLSTSLNEEPWVAHCYYAFEPKNISLIIASDLNTIHGQHMLKNPSVSVGIALETRIIKKIQGVQIKAYAHLLKNEELTYAKLIYFKRFPEALLYPPSTFWRLDIMSVKMTDNRFGLGNKLIWER